LLQNPVDLFYVLSDQQHLHARHVRLIDQTGVGEVAFLLGCFLGQDMTFESMLSLYFSGSRQRKALFGSGIGFHFRHFAKVFGVKQPAKIDKK
jgi:hypothetical protein